MADWTKVEKETGTGTKVVKTEDQESREKTWADLGEATHADTIDWTWWNLLILTPLWAKVKKTVDDWTKVVK